MSYYLVRFYHNGKYVGDENMKARDFMHACKLAQYVARTFVRLEGVEVTGPVTFDVIKA